MAFSVMKTRRLADVDLSRKGSIDKPILDLVDLINSMPAYFTTSSCSGRIILFENESESLKKKGCKWLHVSHETVDVKDIVNALENITEEAVFKFEPMVMHVQCDSISAAQQMHQVAVAAGFRNSGITVGNKGKIMMAVRSTHGLEAPLSVGGKLLVTHEYVSYLVESANKKMEMNQSRIDRFLENVKSLAKAPAAADNRKSKKKKEKPPRADHQTKFEKKPSESTECEVDLETLSIFDVH